jgi:hypothetical protein
MDWEGEGEEDDEWAMWEETLETEEREDLNLKLNWEEEIVINGVIVEQHRETRTRLPLPILVFPLPLSIFFLLSICLITIIFFFFFCDAKELK